ncbi:MAG: T9SS C-terminal target domain-containing protein [Bacteroidetes bacterium]|nr:T9SS C-terminal target domain-containing protein [Bacteroidota bacterium]
MNHSFFVRFPSRFLLIACVVTLYMAPADRVRAQQDATRIDIVVEQAQRDRAAERAAAISWIEGQVGMEPSVIDAVQLVYGNRPFLYTNTNAAAAQFIGLTPFLPGGSDGLDLTGEGVTMGIWDGGTPLTTHQELTGRVSIEDGSAKDDHATHVGGTMIASGASANARGMAPEALLKAYDWTSDVEEMTDFARDGYTISNHSYGLITGWYYDSSGQLENRPNTWYWFGDPDISLTEDYTFGWYDGASVLIDALVFQNPTFLPVVSSGNDGNDFGPSSGSYRALNALGEWQSYDVATRPIPRDGANDGFDTVSGFSLAKNTLSVGSHGYIPRVSGFSSKGPTDDGRIKPDIIAPGEGLRSSLSGSNTQYGIYSGTSMATPVTSGTLGALTELRARLQGEPMMNAGMKGLVIHTATDLGCPGPDYTNAWGRLNAAAAIAQLQEDQIEPASLLEGYLQGSEAFSLPITSLGTDEVRVTLVWTDVPASRIPAFTSSVLNNREPRLKEDFDLTLTRNANAEVLLPYVLDVENPTECATRGVNTVDNVEQIRVSAPAGERFVVDVKRSSTGNQPIPFAILVSGAYSELQPVSTSPISLERIGASVKLNWSTYRVLRPGSLVLERIPFTIRKDDSIEFKEPQLVRTQPLEVSLTREDVQLADVPYRDGAYRYRLSFVEADGTVTELGAQDVTINAGRPDQDVDVFPNPFNDQLIIAGDFGSTYDVEITVSDALGRKVLNTTIPPSQGALVIPSGGWASGVYVVDVTYGRTQRHTAVVAKL